MSEHISDGWGKSYNPNCMCENCHRTWELLVMAGDSITINKWINDTNDIARSNNG